METDRRTEIGIEILQNICEYLNAEFKIQLLQKEITNIDKFNIMMDVMHNLFLNNIIKLSKILEITPLEIYDHIKMRDNIKSIMERKDET
jgi:hypothetical protein